MASRVINQKLTQPPPPRLLNPDVGGVNDSVIGREAGIHQMASLGTPHPPTVTIGRKEQAGWGGSAVSIRCCNSQPLVGHACKQNHISTAP